MLEGERHVKFIDHYISELRNLSRQKNQVVMNSLSKFIFGAFQIRRGYKKTFGVSDIGRSNFTVDCLKTIENMAQLPSGWNGVLILLQKICHHLFHTCQRLPSRRSLFCGFGGHPKRNGDSDGPSEQLKDQVLSAGKSCSNLARQTSQFLQANSDSCCTG